MIDAMPGKDSAAASTGHPAVVIDSVSKTFRLPHQRYSTLKERALHPFRSRVFDELKAVQDISVQIAPGEFFGIVGRNGSGKSTLLKCLAGIYRVDTGSITIDGRLSPFIELGVGFNMDLTARENVIINATMLGLTPKQARERFDDIIAFAGLEEFIDLKLKNYSSGMAVRLAFSIGIEVDADVLLVDEVLAVGDAAFQHKCYQQFERLKSEGKTIIFVTHDMSAVERFCDRAMLVEKGKMVTLGAPREVARAYNQLNFAGVVHEAVEERRHGDRKSAEITRTWFENESWQHVSTLSQGEFCFGLFEVKFLEDMQDPIVGWALHTQSGQTVMAASSQFERGETGAFKAGETVVVKIGFSFRFSAGQYSLSPVVARAGNAADIVDEREHAATLLVFATRSTGGLVDLDQVLEIKRA
ncbi:ABC transporter ATP-binding protein [Solirubrobacter phytolaccae]|uniref:ABC transporter ATP-binding protein n=1 Tax=Solirubrobacter phytolaccae TaxID=1404360 RepID=A0A9X3S8M3_9ACTN|nr:ABC transporter ATP-binding protein [Solirubrobacter phytolaccae]MDA0182374.1 ABC transporter ATP-binding protein [Solirubrobacter phytolaccae]